MTDAATQVRQRAGRFLHAMGQEQVITVHAHSAPRAKGRVGRQFLNALKLGLPFLAMTAAVHAHAASTPSVSLSVDNSPAIEINAAQITQQAQEAALNKAEEIDRVTRCFTDKIANTDLSPAERKFAGVAIYAQAPSLVKEIHDWSEKNNMPNEVGIAAYCENPFNWKGQLQNWINAANKVESSIAQSAANNDPSVSDTATTLLNVYASNALERHAVQRASQYQAIEQAGIYQYELHEQGVLQAQKISGFDWVNAGIAVAQGAAAIAGGRDAEREASRAGNSVRRGARVAKQADRAMDRKGADRWTNIGRAAQEAGRLIHDSGIMNSTPRMRY